MKTQTITTPNTKKGQAAMEFLMTYGWAMLILLVMIGALAYFGVLNPSKYTSDRCIVTTGFECKDYQLKASGTQLLVNFNLGNQQGESIKVTGVSAKSGSYDLSAPCTPAATTGAPLTVPTDSNLTFSCALATGSNPGAGQVAKAQFVVNYTAVNGGTFTHIITGDMYATVSG